MGIFYRQMGYPIRSNDPIKLLIQALQPTVSCWWTRLLRYPEGARLFDREHSVYGNSNKEIPRDAPPPLGKWIVITRYFDANLMHDILSGKAVTGVVHFYNKTAVNWYCKKQSTTETTTYGSEFSDMSNLFPTDHWQSTVPLIPWSTSIQDRLCMGRQWCYDY